jgi:hypothetical protein
MVKHVEEKCEVFAIDAGHSILVGESYLVAAAYRTGTHWFGEQFLLLERPTPHLDRAAVRLDAAGGHGNLVVIDADFIIEALKSFAARRFGSWLTMRYEDTKITKLLAVKFDFAPCGLAALAHCWVRGLYHEQIEQIVAVTQCGELPARLKAFHQLPVFTAG